ncbi:hypothetical protein ACIRJM_22660 [Streptomyces sp. NPDC102405]|uniref:hypothetical protein n=1 Tax=Streptomyces sp. NPDC102405 TaxID=3366170 RepID=UPI0038031CA7
MSSYVPESDECLAALMEATRNLDLASRQLEAAPDADVLTKSAIEVQIQELTQRLAAIARRLDAMPTWKAGQPSAT